MPSLFSCCSVVGPCCLCTTACSDRSLFVVVVAGVSGDVLHVVVIIVVIVAIVIVVFVAVVVVHAVVGGGVAVAFAKLTVVSMAAIGVV